MYIVETLKTDVIFFISNVFDITLTQQSHDHDSPYTFIWSINALITVYSNMTSFFHFVNKRASYPFGMISLAHAPVNVTDFSIGSINCIPNNADRRCSIIRVT